MHQDETLGGYADPCQCVLACPAATACPMLASTYRVGEKSAAAAVTVSTLCSLLTISRWIEHKHYIDKHGEDLPEIRNWMWTAP